MEPDPSLRETLTNQRCLLFAGFMQREGVEEAFDSVEVTDFGGDRRHWPVPVHIGRGHQAVRL